MSLLVLEDGTMPEGANCFALVLDVDNWQRARKSTIWPVAQFIMPTSNEEYEAKEAAILRATDYLNGLSWKGYRAASGRLLAWPRKEVEDEDGFLIPDDVIPEAVKAATCYLAELVYGGTDLQPILERGGRIQTSQIGTLSKTFFSEAPVRDVAAGLADLLRGLVYSLSDYAGVGTGSGGAKTTTINLVQG